MPKLKLLIIDLDKISEKSKVEKILDYYLDKHYIMVGINTSDGDVKKQKEVLNTYPNLASVVSLIKENGRIFQVFQNYGDLMVSRIDNSKYTYRDMFEFIMSSGVITKSFKENETTYIGEKSKIAGMAIKHIRSPR